MNSATPTPNFQLPPPIDDLELFIRQRLDGTHTVEVRFRPANSEVESHLLTGEPPVVQFDAVRLRSLSLNAAAYGQALTAMLFADPRLTAALRTARAHAAGAGVPLRVRLRLDRRDEALHALRWETLHDPTIDPPTFLFTSARTLLSRYLDASAIQTVRLRPRSGLRALVVAANPADLAVYNLPPVDAAGEIERVTQALGDIGGTVLASVGEHLPATWANITAALHRGVDLLYLVCHGAQRGGETFLYLENADGQADLVSARQIVAQISGLSHPPLLVVLAACETAGRGHTEALLALGPQLARAGIGAVLAMHDPVTAAAIRRGMPVFFGELQRHGLVDQALATTRSVLAAHGDEWWKLVLFLRLRNGRLWTAARPLGIFQAPALPPHFVARAELPQLKAVLLASTSSPPGTLVVSALQGLGGIGKSTLAAALAHDVDIQASFPDGILWAEVGQQPDTLAILQSWLLLFGEQLAPAGNLTTAAARVRSWLHTRRVLIILDNVWSPADLHALLLAGPHCRVLLTTRRADVADEIGATRHELGVLSPPESLALLARCVGYELVEPERAAAAHLAAVVGYLPLALELAASQVRRMPAVTWETLTEALSVEIARLEVLDPSRRARAQRGLDASFNLSLKELRAEDPAVWRAFAWLGLLPRGVTITAPLAATLWELPPDAATHTLVLLWQEALLSAADQVELGGRSWSGYRLHDLTHAVARRLLIEQIALPDAHARLLARYRAQTEAGRWHTLPDDGYIHNHVLWHMQQAGQPDAVRALLRETTVDGRNGWHATRERLGQTASYRHDLALAWQDADATLRDAPSSALRDQCRYLLLTASLNSNARNLPPPLLTALVDHALWTPAQALTDARQIGPAQRRIDALFALAPRCAEPFREEALFAVLHALNELSDQAAQAQVLKNMAPLLSNALLPHALPMARALSAPEAQAAALGPLLARLATIHSVAAARNAADQIANQRVRAVVLVALAPFLPESEQHAVLQAMRALRNKPAQAIALAELNRHVADDLLPEALAAASSIHDTWIRARTLVALGPHLPLARLHEALAAAHKIGRADPRSAALAGLLPILAATGDPDAALRETRRIGDETQRVTAVQSIASHLPAPALETALSTLRSLRSPTAQAALLAGLAPCLPEPLLHQALGLAAKLRTTEARSAALVGLLPRLAALGQPQDALTQTLALKNETSRAQALAGLAAHLPADLLPQALVAVEHLRYPEARSVALTGLAHHLPANLLPQALQLTRVIGDGWAQAEALAHLAPLLGAARLPEALAAVLALSPGDTRARLLADLAPHLPADLLTPVLTAPSENEPVWMADLAAVAESLSPALVAQAQTSARRLTDPSARANALAQLVPLALDTLPEALEAARALSRSRVPAQVRLAPHLPEAELSATLADVAAVGNQRERARLLAALAPHLPEALLSQALVIAQQLGSPTVRADALADLAVHLSAPLVQQALALVREEQQHSVRARALRGLAPRLAELGQPQAALDLVRSVAPPESQTAILVRLIPQLAQSGYHDEAVTAIWTMPRRADQGEMLAQVAPYLPEALAWSAVRAALALGVAGRAALAVCLARLAQLGAVVAALEAAWAIADADTLAAALTALLPHLPPDVLWDVAERVRANTDLKMQPALLVALVRRLAETEAEHGKIVASWIDALHALAHQERQEALAGLGQLVPVMTTLGGAADDLAEIIAEVCGWFR